MHGLHQQLAAKRADLKANEVKARSTKADPRDASDAAERVPFLKQEIQRLEAETAFGDEALRLIEQGLALLGNLSAARELNLGVNAAEVAVFRLKNHVGFATK
jgi:hypothetical protein